MVQTSCQFSENGEDNHSWAAHSMGFGASSYEQRDFIDEQTVPLIVPDNVVIPSLGVCHIDAFERGLVM